MLTVNGIKVIPTIFPDKTSQVWKLPLADIEKRHENGIATIVWDFESEAEFMHLAQLRQLLKTELKCAVILSIRYLPYARQDKHVSNEATFALRSFLGLLSILQFDAILLFDPHSHVAEDVLYYLGTKVFVHYPVEGVKLVTEKCEIDLYCYPDKGALEKYSRLYKDRSYIYGKKVRDQLTGRIEKYDLETGDHDVVGKNVLIVDDICDGGATFVLLAKELLSKGAGKVVLFVTHGLFSKGTEVLFESGISRIFTKDGEVRQQ